MQCDRCGERPAAVHLTQIVNSAVTKQHLCDVCANAAGIQTEAAPGQYPLVDFLAALGGVGGALPARPGEDGTCACGATLADFRESGRLGCATCYDTFIASLRTLLRRIHGASQHVGRLYEAPGASHAPRANPSGRSASSSVTPSRPRTSSGRPSCATPFGGPSEF